MADGNIPRQLGAILDVLGLDSNSLFGEENKDSGKNRERVVHWLYRILDTLDSKTSHLLRFAALLLAAQTFLAGLLVGNKQTPQGISIFVLCFLLVPLATAVFGLSVFKVKWLFFGKVRASSKDKPSEDRIKDEIWSLAELCDERFQAHRRSLAACIVSALFFVVTLVFALVVVIAYGSSTQKS